MIKNLISNKSLNSRRCQPCPAALCSPAVRSPAATAAAAESHSRAPEVCRAEVLALPLPGQLPPALLARPPLPADRIFPRLRDLRLPLHAGQQRLQGGPDGVEGGLRVERGVQHHRR